MPHIIITGAPKDQPAVPCRVDIRDFVKNEKWLSLYVQALARLSAKDQNDEKSHFGIGGIHGLPNKRWGDSGSSNAEGTWGGYCTHSTVLFPTWHRPYIAAYEQFLQREATEIAKAYKDVEWAGAAATFRLPYWDWAAAIVPPEEVINMPEITITLSNGPTKVENPLWGYKFHPIDESFTGPFSSWNKTLRRPTNQQADAKDNVDQLKQTLLRQAGQITKHTYMLFSIHDWDHFSNNASSTGSSANSLESVHDSIHVYVGGSGHMAQLPYAGHDPIFFLHHCNVDRLLALWQAIHYDVEITSGDSKRGTWTIKPGTTIGVNTPLTPFWRTQDSSWLSTNDTAGVRDFTLLGYTYPEFKDLDLANREAVRLAISNKAEELYAPKKALPRVHASLETSKGGRNDSSFYPYDREWSVKVTCNQFEVDQSFCVLLFLGNPPPEDSKEWFESPNLVDTQGFFVNSMPEQCENCRNQIEQGITVEKFSHLSDALLDLGIARDRKMENETIIPYLKESLHIRVLKTDSTAVIKLSDFRSLKVEVVSTPLRKVDHSPFPRLGPVQIHFIAHGRVPFALLIRMQAYRIVLLKWVTWVLYSSGESARVGTWILGVRVMRCKLSQIG